jgi:RNA polymerase sigma-70 factor, ECF subfamily
VQPEDDPDVQRMLAVQAGDPGAFQELYNKYARQMVRFAMQFVGSQARAEELGQDVFLQVFRARRRYQPRARFATWLFRIATNACLTEVRRPEHRSRVESINAVDPASDRDVQVDLSDPAALEGETAALSQELRGRIRTLLERLPPQQRAALLLARTEGFSYEDVAASLDCSVSAVKSLIHRATVTLRDGLRDYLEAD